MTSTCAPNFEPWINFASKIDFQVPASRHSIFFLLMIECCTYRTTLLCLFDEVGARIDVNDISFVDVPANSCGNRQVVTSGYDLVLAHSLVLPIFKIKNLG